MSSRSYAQYCGLAAAMDVLGERWAALVVRNLLVGPQRYTDLLNGLPGISTDMLARRLAELEASGIVCRAELPPPAASKVYELTDAGRELEPVVVALARWGLRRLTSAEYDEAAYDPQWMELAIRAAFDPSHAPRRKIVVRFCIDGQELTVALGRSGIAIVNDADPVVIVVSDAKTLTRLLVEPQFFVEAVSSGAFQISGDSEDQGTAMASFRL
jgi:DNA-binding HxlR family transcriptional regulator